ncbi:hypothetical protein LTR56_000549 [Elasticomyces elasticus]|nr:hypothetical protein LTR56_000549 [Elasticomyces elasticus]KAK3664325.1 hypothetical protein LTR22_004738 [Elasticomyces elasticus]KAK4915435.1 hypothetical protein LTR49_016423 [Elasticomyces elasticus]KAK5752818.1 hypothetical protein LTS12_017097 [Elasticomyces elasticus]
MTSNATLLGLPREIRDQIIAYVLVHIEEPPLHWRFARERAAPEINAKPPTDHPDISFTKLRDVNHQLCEEVAEHCHAAYRPNEAKANLDISFSGQWYSPTWTYVPALLQPGRPFDLNIQARILSTESFQRSRPLIGSGYWSLYHAINDLLRRGPSLEFMRHLRATDDTCALKTLTILFSFRDPYTPDTWPTTATEVVRRMQLFATSGVLHLHIERLRVSISYETSNSCYSYNEDWPIEPSVDGVDVSLDDWLQKLA